MRRRGYEVVVATDGQDGIDKAHAERSDLILMDMNMPVMDGWTTAGLLRAGTTTEATPIIALDAHAMSGDREKACAAGHDDDHAKPVDFARLLAQIEAFDSA